MITQTALWTQALRPGLTCKRSLAFIASKSERDESFRSAVWVPVLYSWQPQCACHLDKGPDSFQRESMTAISPGQQRQQGPLPGGPLPCTSRPCQHRHPPLWPDKKGLSSPDSCPTFSRQLVLRAPGSDATPALTNPLLLPVLPIPFLPLGLDDN